jgi:hypothetical protein
MVSCATTGTAPRCVSLPAHKRAAATRHQGEASWSLAPFVINAAQRQRLHQQ